MLHRDECLASKTTRENRNQSVRSKRARFTVETLEDRQLLSGAGVKASIQQAHNLMLAQLAAHRLELRAELLASRHDGNSTPSATGNDVSASSVVSPKRIKKPPAPAAGAPTLSVAFTYQSATDLRNDATIGYLAIGFQQDINLATLNTNTVQLYYKPFNDPSTPNPIKVASETIQYQAGNKAIVVTPGNFIFKGHVQPNGTYYLGITTGVASTAGGHLASQVNLSYTDHTSWGLPGHFPITAASLPGNAPTIPNDTHRGGTPIFNAPGTGVIILDQYMQLDPASVNGSTVQLFKVVDNSFNGAVRVPATVTYDAEIPSIYVIPSVALTTGNYRIAELNTVNFAGSRQTVPVYLDFFVPQNDVPPGGDPNAAPKLNWWYPKDPPVVTVTDLTSMGFNVPIKAATLNKNTILLQQSVGANWVTVPHKISYNAGTYAAYVTPTAGIKSQGTNYRLVVNADPAHPITGTNNQTMSGQQIINFTYNSPKPPFPPLIDAVHWQSFPAPGTTVQYYPAAFQVTLNKWNGYLASSITNKTFQIFAVNGSGQIIGKPINGSGEQVVWNPRSSYAIITLPNVALGDGRYVIVANAANGQPGVGVVDLAGNVQKAAYRPAPFTIKGTGRPQTVG